MERLQNLVELIVFGLDLGFGFRDADLCSGRMGTFGSSLRYSRSTRRPSGLSEARMADSISCGCATRDKRPQG